MIHGCNWLRGFLSRKPCAWIEATPNHHANSWVWQCQATNWKEGWEDFCYYHLHNKEQNEAGMKTIKCCVISPLNFTSSTSFSLSMMSPFGLKVWQGQCTLISKPRLVPELQRTVRLEGPRSAVWVSDENKRQCALSHLGSWAIPAPSQSRQRRPTQRSLWSARSWPRCSVVSWCVRWASQSVKHIQRSLWDSHHIKPEHGVCLFHHL